MNKRQNITAFYIWMSYSHFMIANLRNIWSPANYINIWPFMHDTFITFATHPLKYTEILRYLKSHTKILLESHIIPINDSHKLQLPKLCWLSVVYFIHLNFSCATGIHAGFCYSDLFNNISQIRNCRDQTRESSHNLSSFNHQSFRNK